MNYPRKNQLRNTESDLRYRENKEGVNNPGFIFYLKKRIAERF